MNINLRLSLALFVLVNFLRIAAQPSILITGGSGYVGSAVAALLSKKGYKVIILSEDITNICLTNYNLNCFKGDFADINILNDIFKNNKIEAVVHLAAFLKVDESMALPLDYYINNVAKTIVLLDTMVKHGINKFIFASSCTVYGNSNSIPIRETDVSAILSDQFNTELR